MDEASSYVGLDLLSLDGKADQKIVPLILESPYWKGLVPIPKRSASLQATSTLKWWDSLKALDPNRPIREADICLKRTVVNFATNVPQRPSRSETSACWQRGERLALL